MGKKGGKKSPASGASLVAPEVAPPTSFAEALELDPQKKEDEERAMKQRQAKADAAAKNQAEANAKREWWEKEKQKEARQKDRVDKQWQQEAAKAKAQAVKEGVFVAETWDEETWWVDLGKGKWQEVKDVYWCSLCDKHLNDGTLGSHIQSEAHRKKVEWSKHTSASTASASTASASAAPAAVPKAAAAAPATASGPAAGAKPEEWQQYDSINGCWRCIPCNKVLDQNHVATLDHQKRLEAWLYQQQKASANYPAPQLPYLAEVPWDEDPANDRCLKCLLCNKWVQDEWSHSGTHRAPAGSKEHEKNLRNYPPGSAWWEANVTPQRNRWHPTAAPRGPATSAAAAAGPAARPQPPTAAPWASAASAKAPAPPPSAPPGGGKASGAAAAPSARPAPPKAAPAGGSAASGNGGAAWGQKVPPKAAGGKAQPPGAAVPCTADEDIVDC